MSIKQKTLYSVFMSGWWDLNPRSPGPKPGALDRTGPHPGKKLKPIRLIV